MCQICFTTLVSASAINERASWAELHAVPAGNTGAFAKGHVVVGNQYAAGAAFLETEGGIANQLSTGSDTAAAEDTAVVVQDEIGMGSIHHEGFVGGCDRPVGHAFIIGSLLKVTVTIGVLAVHAEVVALAEDHRKDKFPRGFGLVCVGVNDHIITRRHNTRRL